MKFLQKFYIYLNFFPAQYETHNETLNSSLRRSELQKKDLEDSLQSLDSQLHEMRGKEESMTRIERERDQKTVGLEHMSREVKYWTVD